MGNNKEMEKKTGKKTVDMKSYKREYMREYMKKYNNQNAKKINCVITFSNTYTDEEINDIKDTLQKIGEKLHIKLNYYNAGRKKKIDPEKEKEDLPEQIPEEENVENLSEILASLMTVIT